MKIKVLTIFATILFCFSLMGNLSAAPILLEKSHISEGGGVTVGVVTYDGGVTVGVVTYDNILISSLNEEEAFITVKQGERIILEVTSTETNYIVDTEGWAKGQYQLVVETSAGTNEYIITKL